MLNALFPAQQFNGPPQTYGNGRRSDDHAFVQWASSTHPTWRQDPAEAAIARDEWQQMQGSQQPAPMADKPISQMPDTQGNGQGNGQGGLPWGAIAGGALGLLGGGGAANALLGAGIGNLAQKFFKKQSPVTAGASGGLSGLLGKYL